MSISDTHCRFGACAPRPPNVPMHPVIPSMTHGALQLRRAVKVAKTQALPPRMLLRSRRLLTRTLLAAGEALRASVEAEEFLKEAQKVWLTGWSAACTLCHARDTDKSVHHDNRRRTCISPARRTPCWQKRTRRTTTLLSQQRWTGACHSRSAARAAHLSCLP
jgi:hypothetical protein